MTDVTTTVAVPAAPASAPELGFSHFISQTDAVGQGLFIILVIMSVISWGLILTRGVALVLRQRRSRAFLDFFWNATSLEAVQNEIATHGASEPFAHLTAHAMHAQAHHARFGAAKLEEAGSAQDFLTRTIKKVLDEETMRMESGLSVLATIGATAAVIFFAYGTCRNSLGPCALLLGPSTPQTIICALGKPWLSMFISGIVPPWPI